MANFFNSLKDAIAGDNQWGWLGPILFYFMVGFVAGLVTRLVGRFVLWAGLVSVAVILLLHYMGILTIDIISIKNSIGIDGQLTISQILEVGWQWIQKHIVESISALVGFIIAFEFIK